MTKEQEHLVGETLKYLLLATAPGTFANERGVELFTELMRLFPSRREDAENQTAAGG